MIGAERLLNDNRCLVGLVTNCTWNAYNFRFNLLREIDKQGYQTIVFAPFDDYADKLPCPAVHIDLQARGVSPINDARYLLNLIRTYRRFKPSVLLHYTAKPNIYGTLAARMCRIPTINNIAGLGSTFSEQSAIKALMIKFYRFSQRHATRVYFQNEHDRDEFLNENIVSVKQVGLLPGSGVDIDYYYPTEVTKDFETIRFLFVTRLIREKGVQEYIDAAHIIKRKYASRVIFDMAGLLVAGGRDALTLQDIKAWNKDGAVNYLGSSDDVRGLMAQADCVVLPSYYREGVPRVLLEAASMGIPLIAAQNVGCAAIVHSGHNGYLCYPRSAIDLAEKMERFINLSREEKLKMGMASRRMAVEKYDEAIIFNKYLADISNILQINDAGRPANQEL